MMIPFKKNDVISLAGTMDKVLKTNELFHSNDYYGHATVLKKYADMPEEYQSKLIIEHGVTFLEGVWDNEKKSDLSCYITISKARSKEVKSYTNKVCFPIGPYIKYAESILSNEQLSMYKRAFGKTLLIIPSHSTHWKDVHYDINDFISAVKNIGADFNTIIVCMYWKDIIRGVDKLYADKGMLCTTAGHIYDKNFLKRLRSLFELSDYVMSNDIGTHLIYSICMDRPFYLYNQDLFHESRMNDNCGLSLVKNNEKYSKYKKIKQVFSVFENNITRKQKDLVSYFGGFEFIKNKDELNDIFMMAEEIHK